MTEKVGADQVMTKNRPTSIIWFERLFGASIFLAALRALVGWSEKFSDGDFETGGSTGATVLLMLTTLFIFAIDMGLWYFIARRASKIAKWILLGKTSIGLAVIMWTFPWLLRTDLVILIVPTLLLNFLVILSIMFLFRRDARSWFHEKSIVQSDAVDLAERFR